MLNILLYKNPRHIFKNICDQYTKIKIVVPDPQMADDLRAQTLRDHLETDINIQTISYYIDLEIKSYRELNIHRCGKAELLLILGQLFKKKNSRLSIEKFNKIFKIFTEIRSFTFDKVILGEVLSDYDEETQKNSHLFFEFCEQLNIVDEPSLYKVLIQEKLKEIEEGIVEKNDEVVVFWGFTFLSGIQIDYIKTISESITVIIPFSKTVYENSSTLDWIKWLDLHADVQSIEESHCETLRVPTYFYESGKIVDAFKDFKKEFLLNENFDLVIATQEKTMADTLEIPFSLNFKIKTSLFANDIDKVKEDIDYLVTKKKITTGQSFTSYIEKAIKDEIAKYPPERNFKKIKILSILKNIVERSLEHIKSHYTKFDVNLLFQIVELESPRSFYRPQMNDNNFGNIYDLKEVDSISFKRPVIFYINKRFKDYSKEGLPYSDKVLKIISTISPVKREEFLLEILKQKIIQVLSENDVYLFIDRTVYEGSLLWNYFLEDIEQVPLIRSFKKDELKVKDIASRPIEKTEKNSIVEFFSATKLQSYLDCPQQYYYKYIDKKISFPKIHSQLQNFQLGRLEHLVIQEYFKHKTRWDEDFFKDKIFNNIKDFLKLENIELDPFEYSKTWIEIESYTKNVIKFLVNFFNSYNNFSFEKDFLREDQNKIKFKGIIDLVIESKDAIFLFDFKRGKGSIPTLTELMDFQKVQLWFYLSHYFDSYNKEILLGYICLKSLDDSIFFHTESLFEKAKNIKLIGKVYPLKNMLQKIGEYKKFETKLVDQLVNDQNYFPLPKAKICDYCSINKICTKAMK